MRGAWSVKKAGTFPGNGIGPQWGILHSSPPPPSNLADLDPMFYDDRSMDAGKGLGVWGAWYTEKAGTFPVYGIGPQWWITHSSPPPSLISWSELLFTWSPSSYLKSNILITLCLRYESLSVSIPHLWFMLHTFFFLFLLYVFLFFFFINQLKNLVNGTSNQPHAAENIILSLVICKN